MNGTRADMEAQFPHAAGFPACCSSITKTRMRRCAAQGICGVKLHNAPVIVDGADPALWRSAAWAEVFGGIERLGLPVLWHVTQRLTGSPYTGGGRNAYWKDGWEKGVRYTNEDLLGIYLGIVERYPDIPFISAHARQRGEAVPASPVNLGFLYK